MINKKFTYKEVYRGAHEILMGIEQTLNYYGDDGWELVDIIVGHMFDNPTQIANYRFIFKKEVI